MKIPIGDLKCRDDVQARLKLHEDTVRAYHGRMVDGETFPLVDVVVVDGEYVVVDGNHRVEASRRAGYAEVECTVHEGDLAEAKRFSACSNGKHGLRPSIKDNRRAIMMALVDPTWVARGDVRIAHDLGINVRAIATVRRNMDSGDQEQLDFFQRQRGTTEAPSEGDGETEECADEDVPAAGGTLPEMDAAALGQHTAIEISLPDVPTYYLGELPVGDLAADRCVLIIRSNLLRLRDAENLATHWGFTVQATLIAPLVLGGKRRQRGITVVATRGHENLGGPEAIIERLYEHGEGIALFRHRSGWKHWPVMRNDSSPIATTDTMRRGLRTLRARIAAKGPVPSGKPSGSEE